MGGNGRFVREEHRGGSSGRVSSLWVSGIGSFAMPGNNEAQTAAGLQRRRKGHWPDKKPTLLNPGNLHAPKMGLIPSAELCWLASAAGLYFTLPQQFIHMPQG